MSKSSHALFCYGTLCIPDIMRAVSGYNRGGHPARLHGYQRVALHGRHYPGVVPYPDAVTEGVLHQALNGHQLRRIDHYEGNLYLRIRVQVNIALAEQVQTWTYVLHPRYYHLTKKQPWSLTEFMMHHQAAYQHQHGW